MADPTTRDELAIRRRLDEVQLEAAGALIGWFGGKGEPGPYWSEAFLEGFNRAIRIAFDAGREVERGA